MAKSDELTSRANKALSEASNPEAARNALGRLFPTLGEAIGVYASANDKDVHFQRREFRIANKDFANSYFSLDPIPARWNKETLRQLLDAPDPRAALVSVEQNILSAPEKSRTVLRRIFLEQLESAFQRAEVKFSSSWFDALVAMSPAYIKAPDDSAGVMFATDFFTRLEFVIVVGLHQAKPRERAHLFDEAIRGAEDISLLCGLFRMTGGDAVEESTGDTHRMDFGGAVEDLRSALLAKVHLFASDGRIWVQAAPARILWFWWGTGRQQEVFDLTQREMTNPIALRVLLDTSVSLVRSSLGNYDQIPASVGKILDLARLKTMAKSVIERSGDDVDRRLAERFLAAFERGLLD